MFPTRTATIRPEHCDPQYLLSKLGLHHTHCALLESVDHSHKGNDFSFLAIGARDVMVVRDGVAEGSAYLGKGEVSDPLKPFESFIDGGNGGRLSMGYVGFLSYEAARFFEDIDLQPGQSVPDAQFFLPEAILRINHASHEVTIVVHGDSKLDIDDISETVMQSPFFDEDAQSHIPHDLPTLADIDPFRQMERKDFCTAVEAMQENILAGEAFQIVMSQELLFQQGPEPVDVYRALRAINPSPYMYYFQTPECTIVGASPETLIRVTGRDILYRPIAGTRKRTGDEEVDKCMQEELLSDEKERCEHQMLVDLGRNDVGRIAEIGSVKVRDPFHIEQFAHVYHIITDITGTLREDLTSLDALRAVFPAGTLTGAPKLRSMEIIRNLENTSRGIYGGGFGYIDQSGDMDFAITIRTMLFDERGISLRVGAGIVKDSVPEREDNECLHKARSCLAAIRRASSSPQSASTIFESPPRMSPS